MNYLTSYGYDVLDNLTTVTQGTQTRTFVYDSLKRLTSATNPESSIVSYQYDNNGNLLVKTDARNVSTHYSYDALNQPVRRWYNGSSSLTATVHNSPALPAGVGTSAEAFYFYDSQTLPTGAPTFDRGFSTGRLVAVTYGTGSSEGNYFGYDALGRPLRRIQQTGSVNYQVSVVYNLSGGVTSQTYPSGRTVSYNYDPAGRLGDKDAQNLAFTGTLGDGVNRNYSTEILYSPFGGMAKEKFGTDTPLYNKSFYNSRGQLSEIRVSTSYTGPPDTTWNRGAIINHYSNQCGGACNGTDNNGNLKKQEVFIPLNDQLPITSWTSWWQQYEYDTLNRLERVKEFNSSNTQLWQQEYVYDRWGNRTIDQNQTKTWGTGINKKDFTVNTANNRLGVPAGQSGEMSYDDAGNLTNDTYTGAGSRVYDAENRMIKAWGGNNQWQEYSYNADGQRVRRKIDGVETRQIYGMDGELLAEYAANTVAGGPQKEYGYRNGQLLITASPSSRTNVALSANGATATASSTLTDSGYTFLPSHAINGTRWPTFYNDVWLDSTFNAFSDWIQIDFNGSKTISEIDVFTAQADPQNPVNPTLTQTFTPNGGIALFDVQYWNGSSWATVPGGSVAGNDKVWRQFTFASITTSKIRVVVNDSLTHDLTRIVEVEAWTGASGSTLKEINWLLADQLGTPRMVFDKTGSLATTKRHDYLPFGEELFAGVGGRSIALGYAADTIRQKFTSKERDNETGLDYFGARYYMSVQGRFTGADPFDINFERQITSDPEEADKLFKNYIGEPQHWNRYAYALNNPLRYVDPDGLLEYETELLGKKIKVKISDNLKSADGKKLKGDDLKAAQEKIKKNIDSAIAKINSGADKLTSEEKTAINSMKGIEVRTDIRFPGMNGSTFQMTQRYAETDDPETLPAAFIHDSFHADQNRRGVPSSGTQAEKQASAFTFPILEKFGMSKRIIEVYKKDAKAGHGEWGQKTRPPKKKTP